MTGNWQSSFGTGGPIRPSSPSYARLVLTADTALVWPLESSSGTPSLVGLLNVVPGQAGLTLSLPDATQGGTGIISIITNSGSTSFVLANTYAQQVGVIGAGEAWVLSSLDNGAPAGSWNLIQLGTLTSQAQAGQLAGAGLKASGALLNVAIQTFEYSTDEVLSTTHDASGVILEGGVGRTFQLDSIANVGSEWWVLVSNQSTENLTISTSGGDTINGVAQIVLPPGGSGQPYSCLIVAASGGFNTFAGTPPIIPIAGGGTGAQTAGQALINLGGGTMGIQIFEAETAAAVLALLGVGASAFSELTVSTNQVVNSDSINTAYVATAPITITLPLTTGLTNEFVIAIFAQAGAVTLTPDPADHINAGAAGANLVMPIGSSMLLTTDANGQWWPFFYGGGSSSTTTSVPWCIATGSGDAIVAAFAPAIVALTDGLLLNFRSPGANSIGAPTIDVNALGPQPIKKWGNSNLNAKDIPAANAEVQVRWNNGGAYFELMAPTQNLDLIGNTQGEVLFRDASAWNVLAPGVVGQKLKTLGAGANPAWDFDLPGAQQAVASAATCDIGTVAYNNVNITGTTNISGFGASASVNQPIYFIEFADALTLQHGAGLILPGNVDITTAAGDTCIAEYLGSGNWKVRQYTILATGEGGGTTPVAGSLIPVQSLFFSATGGVLTPISSVGGVTIARTGAGQFNVTLGVAALTIGFVMCTASNSGGDILGMSEPFVTLAASNTYAFQFRYGSSKTLTDPDRCLLLFY